MLLCKAEAWITGLDELPVVCIYVDYFTAPSVSKLYRKIATKWSWPNRDIIQNLSVVSEKNNTKA